MSFGGTISATGLMVGANGFGFFTGLACNRLLRALGTGRALMRDMPLSGGRSGNKNPSSCWASHSLNVVYFMPVSSGAAFNNKRNTGSW